MIPEVFAFSGQDGVAGALLLVFGLGLAALGVSLLVASWKNKSKRRYSF